MSELLAKLDTSSWLLVLAGACFIVAAIGWLEGRAERWHEKRSRRLSDHWSQQERHRIRRSP